MAIHALILAGGAGTRFWPASRAARPKQLLPLTSERPLLVETIERVRHLVGPRVLIASSAPVASATRQVVPELTAEQLLVEPVPRNTAPCIGWGVATIARADPDAIVIVLPSDHHVADQPAFERAMASAVESARAGFITTIGIEPTRPETGYGYIELGDAVGDARRVVRFVEKPSREIAARYVEGKRHLWNAGMFIFRARDMRAAIEQHLPALAEGLDVFDRAAASGDEASAVRAKFGDLPAVSIDVGVMEKVADLRVVPANIGWSDVGSWEAAWELASRDAAGNAVQANAVLIDSKENLVVDLRSDRSRASERVVALVGVTGFVIVETDDALLVVPRSRCQDVKQVVEDLRAKHASKHC
jgi:mannose-1-phosphate guanylyltransferase